MELQDSPDIIFRNTGTPHHSSADSDEHACGCIHVSENRADWLVRGSSVERTTGGGVNYGREDFVGRMPAALDESSANAMSLAETLSPGASNDSARCSASTEQGRHACAISNYLLSNEHSENKHSCGHRNREALSTTRAAQGESKNMIGRNQMQSSWNPIAGDSGTMDVELEQNLLSSNASKTGENAAKHVLQPMPELFDSVETTTSDLDDMPLLSNPEPAVQPAKQEATLSHSLSPGDVGLENIHLEAVSSMQPLHLRTVCDGERAESIICSITEVLYTPRHRHRSSDFLPEHSGLPEYVQQVSLLSTLNDVRLVAQKQMAQTSVQMPGVLPTVLSTTPLVADTKLSQLSGFPGADQHRALSPEKVGSIAPTDWVHRAGKETKDEGRQQDPEERIRDALSTMASTLHEVSVKIDSYLEKPTARRPVGTNTISAETSDTRGTSREEGAGIRSEHSSEYDGGSMSLHDVTSDSMTPENSLRQTLSALPSVWAIAQTKQALTERRLSREGLLHEQAFVQRKMSSEFDSASLCSSFDAISEAAFNKWPKGRSVLFCDIDDPGDYDESDCDVDLLDPIPPYPRRDSSETFARRLSEDLCGAPCTGVEVQHKSDLDASAKSGEDTQDFSAAVTTIGMLTDDGKREHGAKEGRGSRGLEKDMDDEGGEVADGEDGAWAHRHDSSHELLQLNGLMMRMQAAGAGSKGREHIASQAGGISVRPSVRSSVEEEVVVEEEVFTRENRGGSAQHATRATPIQTTDR